MGLLDIWFLNYGEKEEAIIKIFQKDCINLLVETIDLFNCSLCIKAFTQPNGSIKGSLENHSQWN